MSEPANSEQLLNKLYREAAARRHKMKALKEEYEASKQQLESLQKEFEDYRKEAEAKAVPSDEVDRLRKELGQIKHKDAFGKVAKSLGVADTAVEAAWKLSEYQPEGDPVEDGIKEILSRTLEANPFLKGASEQAEKSHVQPGPGFSKGKVATTAKQIVSRKDYDNPRWRFRNQWIGKALAENNLEIIDD